jgi:S-adenosylmethionine:tRNA ribosyltransferase-isomerase
MCTARISETGVSLPENQYAMNTADFDYTLPEALIAQEPAPRRTDARMLVVQRADGKLAHRTVADLPDYLRAGDLLVVNNTRVIPARLYGRKDGTGGQVELLLLEPTGAATWLALCRAARRPQPGTTLTLAGGRLHGRVLALGEGGRLELALDGDAPLLDILEAAGEAPLPPYIKRVPGDARGAVDRLRYQTVYASVPGAVAAPTAGLHFTPELLDRLAARGVRHVEVTLHVGIGTFRPVAVARVADHRMDEERYAIDDAAAAAIRKARAAGARIVAVGSTTVRTLETVAAEYGAICPCRGRSSLFIHPPYAFRAVDAMFTNFHLPKSTLLMMVSALAGRDLIRRAYQTAIDEGYRFYSYGDSMLIL